MGVNGYTQAICPSCRELANSDLPDHYLGDRRILCFNEICGQITRLTPNGNLIIVWKKDVRKRV